jgi:hypothetical protein
MSGFATAEVRKMPRLACVGYVDDITEAKDTESGMYANCRVSIIGSSGASRKITTNFLFRPEWFTPGFNPETINQLEDPELSAEDLERTRKGLYMSYRRIFGTRESTGQLEAMIGGKQNLEALAAKRDALYASGGNKEFTPQQVGELVRSFVLDTAANVGYVLKQATEKTDEVNENGKAVYALREQYEVGEWFIPTADNQKRMVTRAKKAKDGDFLVAFEV